MHHGLRLLWLGIVGLLTLPAQTDEARSHYSTPALPSRKAAPKRTISIGLQVPVHEARSHYPAPTRPVRNPATAPKPIVINGLQAQTPRSEGPNQKRTDSPTIIQGSGTGTNPLGNAVLQFVRNNIGRKVDNGECAMLAVRALRHAGAKSTGNYGVSGPDKDYIWGRLLKNWNDAQPGDVIQFRNVVLELPHRRRNGRMTYSTSTIAHHTAIVAAVLDRDRFLILEQNVGPKTLPDSLRKTVKEGTLDLRRKKSGKIWFYRPVKR
jgi:hypothetical protein